MYIVEVEVEVEGRLYIVFHQQVAQMQVNEIRNKEKLNYT